MSQTRLSIAIIFIFESLIFVFFSSTHQSCYFYFSLILSDYSISLRRFYSGCMEHFLEKGTLHHFLHLVKLSQ